jgi:hypothetical protein
MNTPSIQPTASLHNRQLTRVLRRPWWYNPLRIFGILLCLITLLLIFPFVQELLAPGYHLFRIKFTVFLALGCVVIAVLLWSKGSKPLLDPHSPSWITTLLFFIPKHTSSVSVQAPRQSADPKILTLPSTNLQVANTATGTLGQLPIDELNTTPFPQPRTGTPGLRNNDPDTTQEWQFNHNPSTSPIFKRSPFLPTSHTVTELAGIRTFALPRDGINLNLSADRSASNLSRGRYALADGVSTSFLPGRWAELVAEQFVNHPSLPDASLSPDDFERWLSTASQKWLHWVQNDWIPQASVASGQTNWDREIKRGAGTTFIGCSFSRDHLRQHGQTNIHVTAVGDAVFFLVSRDVHNPHRWTHSSYRLQKAEDFGHETETLASPKHRIMQDWYKIHQSKFLATRSHIIVLATDALAQWIMHMSENDVDPWQELFALPENDIEAFKQFVDHYRRTGDMEIDDTTLMMIGLSTGQSNNA